MEQPVTHTEGARVTSQRRSRELGGQGPCGEGVCPPNADEVSKPLPGDLPVAEDKAP